MRIARVARARPSQRRTTRARAAAGGTGTASSSARSNIATRRAPRSGASGRPSDKEASPDEVQGKYCLVEAVVPPSLGAPPNHHAGETEAFHVLDGEIEFRIGEGTVRAATGRHVAIPDGAVHAFAAVGERPARVLILNAPGRMHERFFTELGTPVDEARAAPEPLDGPPDLDRVLSVARRSGMTLLPRTFKVLPEDVGGAFALWEELVPEGVGPPLHVHRGQHEVFAVLEGRLRFRCGDEETEIDAGGTVLIPPDTPHTFRGLAAEGSRCLLMLSPGAGASFFLAVEREGLKPGRDMPRIVEIGLEHGLEFVGPPLD